MRNSFGGCLKYKLLIAILFSFMEALFPAEAVSGNRTVIDLLGRKIVLSDNPSRVIALAPSITEIVFALGQGHRLVGVTRYSDFPSEAKEIQRVGSYVDLDIERIVSLEPDLCIATKDGNSREVVLRLETLNIPVYAVEPRDLVSVMDTIIEIGGLLNVSGTAGKLVKTMRSRIDSIDSLVSKADNRPRVFFQIGVSPIVSVGTHTYIHELIVRAGGENLAQGKVPYQRFSWERVLMLSPEVFIITSMGRGRNFEKLIARWRRWPDLPAVRDNRIIVVDSNILDRPSPRLVEGLELLARVIHPELFE